MPVPTRKRTKVGASVVKRLVASGSRVSKRGVAKGASRLLVAASKVPPPLVASVRVEPEAEVVELLAALKLS